MRKSVLSLALLFTMFFMASSLNPYSTPFATAAPRPQAFFSPPSAQSGTGYSLNLADSVNGWQTRSSATGSALATCQSPYRNATLMQGPPSGFNVAWQNLTVSKLTATLDFREVQYAPSSLSYLNLTRSGTFHGAAMRFILPDAVNLTSVWLYYYSNSTASLAQLQVVSKGTLSDTPNGGSVISNSSLPSTSGLPTWHEVFLSKPVSLTKNNYYWIVLNASRIPASSHMQILWAYVTDSGGSPDQKFASAYTSTWVNETVLHTSYARPFLNLMLVLKVLPVVAGFPSRIMTYSSPSQVRMRELNSNTTMLQNSTRIPYIKGKPFILGTNTSVTFTVNWTARFERYQPNVVETDYSAQSGLTSWNAIFASAAKPSNSYIWYNRTLTVTSVPVDWLIDPVNNVTNYNNINFTASYVIGSGYIIIRQTDNVTATPVWDSWWVISSASPYSITASAPLQLIMGQQYNISISTNLAFTHCNITLYDSTDSIVFSRSISLPVASIHGFPIRLNQTGDFIIAAFDEADNAPEVSYVLTPTIVSVQALTSLDLSQTMRASWGDIITISFRYRNTTLGSDKEFPTLPDVVLVTSSENFTIKNIQATGGGWFSFSFETRFLPSSGGYILTIMISYQGSYLNQKTISLQLDPPGISPLMVVLAGGGSGGAVIAVVAASKYLSKRKAKDEEKVKMLRQTTSLAQLVVVHLGSGIAAYSRSLGTEESVDPNLISGFLTANQSIMSQIFKGKAPSGLKFADYGEYKVVSHVGKYVMASLFCTEAASEELQNVLEKFTEEFESKYENELAAWHGDVDLFKSADSMVDRVFSLRLISPFILVLDRLAKVKLSGVEKMVVDYARRLSIVRGIFFMPRIIDFMLTNKKVKRSKIVDIIDSLVKKGVFKQLTVDEAAQIVSLTEYGSESNDDVIGDLLENGS